MGEIVTMTPSGDMPSRAAGSIYVSLRRHEGKTLGRAYAGNVGFIVNLPSRESFSPDAAWYIGPPAGMRFLEGAPVFAVEIRSENDYGAYAEGALAMKRADYFAAGTLVVWDVDLIGSDIVKSYEESKPDRPSVFRRGDIADAERAVPGWRIPINELFA